MSTLRISECKTCGYRAKISSKGEIPNCCGNKMILLGYVKDESLKINMDKVHVAWIKNLTASDFTEEAS